MLNHIFHRWLEACLKEELPPTTELEESFTNGVTLAKLGNFFAPKVVPVRKIYDRDLKRYEVSKQAFDFYFDGANSTCLSGLFTLLLKLILL